MHHGKVDVSHIQAKFHSAMAVIAERTEVQVLKTQEEICKRSFLVPGSSWGSGLGERHTWSGSWLPWHCSLPWIGGFLSRPKNPFLFNLLNLRLTLWMTWLTGMGWSWTSLWEGTMGLFKGSVSQHYDLEMMPSCIPGEILCSGKGSRSVCDAEQADQAGRWRECGRGGGQL